MILVVRALAKYIRISLVVMYCFHFRLFDINIIDEILHVRCILVRLYCLLLPLYGHSYLALLLLLIYIYC